MEVRQRLVDRYALGRVLGEGSMGAVYEAWDEREDTWRAVKILHLPMSGSRTVRERFRREAQVLARLDHPHIVRVFEYGEDDGVAFLVMELLPGGSLLGWIERHRAMPPAMAARAGLQVCAAIDAAHAQGIIHRDIKPSNVLVAEGSICRVVDFGIARLDEDALHLTRTGVRMGSPGFMAPEQEVNAKDVDLRADIFGLGATLFALVTNQVPHDMSEAINQDLPVLSGPLGRVIMRATLTRPAQRFESAVEMAAALQRAMERLPPVPTDTPPLYQPVIRPERPTRAAPTLVAD